MEGSGIKSQSGLFHPARSAPATAWSGFGVHDLRGGLAFNAHILLYHPTLGSRAFWTCIESNKEEDEVQDLETQGLGFYKLYSTW